LDIKAQIDPQYNKSGGSSILYSHQLISVPHKKNQKGNFSIKQSIDEMDLTDIYRIFHPTVTKYTFFSMTH
jgi:exonuclease III